MNGPHVIIPKTRVFPLAPEKNLHEVPVGHMWTFAKGGFHMGTFIGIYDAVMLRDQLKPLAIAKRAMYYALPLSIMATAYTSTQFIAQDLTSKDNVFNHLLGAGAAGGVLHAWKRNSTLTHYCTFFFMIGAAVYHESLKVDAPNVFDMFKDIEKNRVQHKYYFPSFSLVKDQPKGWTT